MSINYGFILKLQFYILLIFVALSVSGKQVNAQQVESSLRLAAVTDSSVSFYESNSTGELEIIGNLPLDVGIEAYGSTADWLMLGSSSIALAPNGRQIAFAAKSNTESRLFVYDFSTNNLMNYAIDSYWLLPVWSPDSHGILLKTVFPYFGSEPIPDDYVFDVTTGSLTQVTYTPSIETTIQWMPDNSGIIYYGSCAPLTCNRQHSDIYVVNTDGTNRHSLTDLDNATEIEEPSQSDVCHITWSPSNERFYYVLGCAKLDDNAHDKLYSVDLLGSNRLELDLSAFDPSNSTSIYNDIVSAAIIGSNVYVTEQSVVIFKEGQGGSFWRVIRLGTEFPSSTDLIYQRENTEFELVSSVLSEDGESIAFLDSASSITVVALSNHEDLSHVTPSQGVICDLRWFNDNMLIYNEGGSNCDIANLSMPEQVWNLDTITDTTMSIAHEINGPVWFLPSSETSAS